MSFLRSVVSSARSHQSGPKHFANSAVATRADQSAFDQTKADRQSPASIKSSTTVHQTIQSFVQAGSAEINSDNSLTSRASSVDKPGSSQSPKTNQNGLEISQPRKFDEPENQFRIDDSSVMPASYGHDELPAFSTHKENTRDRYFTEQVVNQVQNPSPNSRSAIPLSGMYTTDKLDSVNTEKTVQPRTVQDKLTGDIGSTAKIANIQNDRLLENSSVTAEVQQFSQADIDQLSKQGTDNSRRGLRGENKYSVNEENNLHQQENPVVAQSRKPDAVSRESTTQSNWQKEIEKNLSGLRNIRQQTASIFRQQHRGSSTGSDPASRNHSSVPEARAKVVVQDAQTKSAAIPLSAEKKTERSPAETVRSALNTTMLSMTDGKHATATQRLAPIIQQGPKVQIGQVDVIIQTAQPVTRKTVTAAPGDMASRHYLRRL